MARNVLLLPWLQLSESVFVDGFWFKPLNADTADTLVGPAMGPVLRKLLKCYVDFQGRPMDGCTLVTRRNHGAKWDIPRNLWSRVSQATSILMMSFMSEQRFYQQLSPHMNATMFDLVGQGVQENSDGIALFHRRRGMSLSMGGLKFDGVRFQRPLEIEHTSCGPFNQKLARALTRARMSNEILWARITAGIEFFKLGHAEAPQRDWDECCMLSALAFEKLLAPASTPTSVALSIELAHLLQNHVSIRLKDAKRVLPDSNPKYRSVQQNWPLHQKWMKELYELRSATAHHGPRGEFSSNWVAEQHIVIAAFVFMFALKLILSQHGFYSLSDEEAGACDAIDMLLDSDWGNGWRRPPEWPNILSHSEQWRAIRASVELAIAAAG
ncbi:hypothetical protein GFL88_19365 [Rhizobium leguminosarum bv. viciae]|uniref:hypothetical protein n=1 Tax=Rhizobium leguminosarum TaxID=384 RepID=UPI001441B1AD|nr:hypothetical protein [Rhizobium leguminosarum]NKK65650.1 hypothetical protein [Rhizobium leguminosarum bv. viciae]